MFTHQIFKKKPKKLIFKLKTQAKLRNPMITPSGRKVLTKYNEESEALILQIKQNDKAKEESNSKEVKHNCYKCEFMGKLKKDLRTHVITIRMKKAGTT
jgi:hypothetical protein